LKDLEDTMNDSLKKSNDMKAEIEKKKTKILRLERLQVMRVFNETDLKKISERNREAVKKFLRGSPT